MLDGDGLARTRTTHILPATPVRFYATGTEWPVEYGAIAYIRANSHTFAQRRINQFL